MENTSTYRKIKTITLYTPVFCLGEPNHLHLPLTHSSFHPAPPTHPICFNMLTRDLCGGPVAPNEGDPGSISGQGKT